MARGWRLCCVTPNIGPSSAAFTMRCPMPSVFMLTEAGFAPTSCMAAVGSSVSNSRMRGSHSCVYSGIIHLSAADPAAWQAGAGRCMQTCMVDVQWRARGDWHVNCGLVCVVSIAKHTQVLLPCSAPCSFPPPCISRWSDWLQLSTRHPWQLVDAQASRPLMLLCACQCLKSGCNMHAFYLP